MFVQCEVLALERYSKIPWRQVYNGMATSKAMQALPHHRPSGSSAGYLEAPKQSLEVQQARSSRCRRR
jgi:hypothetical protein